WTTCVARRGRGQGSPSPRAEEVDTMDPVAVVLIVVLVVVVIVVGWAIATYNGFVKLRSLVQEAWRQIDVELHRRYDLIPNLIETVKGYAAHERAVFDEVTRARAAAANAGSASPAQRAAQEDVLSGAIGRLFAVAEAYPQLRPAERRGGKTGRARRAPRAGGCKDKLR